LRSRLLRRGIAGIGPSSRRTSVCTRPRSTRATDRTLRASASNGRRASRCC